MTALERLMSRRSVVSECWVYTGALTRNGYGSIRVDGVTLYAHRLSYIHHVGRIPIGTEIDHLCRNRACFNPAHLEAVSRHENLHRSPLTWQANASKTHCPRDHEYTPENTYLVGTSRACVACRRARYHAKKAAA
jgi:hypothetical protein